MELGKESADQKRKRIIQIVFVFFVGLLLFFTLFSNTLQSLTLPKVGTEKPSKGGLDYTIEGSGMLQPFAEVKLSNSADWKVQKILVKEGEHVKKGQMLIVYDSRSAEQEIDVEETTLEKQKIEQQNTQDQFIQSAMEEDELKLRNAKREIEKGKLEMAAQERKIIEMRTRLTGQKQLTSPFDGIVTQVNAIEGLASTGEPDVIVSNSSLGFRLEIHAEAKVLKSLGIRAGEQIEVYVDVSQTQQAKVINGKIEEVVNANPRSDRSSDEEAGQGASIPQKTLRIKVADSDLKGGEQASIRIEKRSVREGLLVSSEAVHQDRQGPFVYKVEEQRGALGNVFVARKVRIMSSEKNEKETMIESDSLYEEDAIIVDSSEPLQDGNRVRLQ
ncbi:biotin/lipoyl-binding protein [Paenibacillus sp. HJL G12]|uniref:Biotin/lipoyl-binding protein n=1 Tax=Paenibacillus dendrobii TaxID=2691084 RepID=A0A7X3IGH4_9BACL|nr:biotin/lipoyl-binding protein [Paenibacillus dendrobii]MWV42841.1 biotin/lipoyl-binding protein [Paenibacillus dendrobii]